MMQKSLSSTVAHMVGLLRGSLTIRPLEAKDYKIKILNSNVDKGSPTRSYGSLTIYLRAIFGELKDSRKKSIFFYFAKTLL